MLKPAVGGDTWRDAELWPKELASLLKGICCQLHYRPASVLLTFEGLLANRAILSVV